MCFLNVDLMPCHRRLKKAQYYRDYSPDTSQGHWHCGSGPSLSSDTLAMCVFVWPRGCVCVCECVCSLLHLKKYFIKKRKIIYIYIYMHLLFLPRTQAPLTHPAQTQTYCISHTNTNSCKQMVEAGHQTVFLTSASAFSLSSSLFFFF